MIAYLSCRHGIPTQWCGIIHIYEHDQLMPPTPPNASWRNLEVRFLRDRSENALRRGVFASAAALPTRLAVYRIEHHQRPTMFSLTQNAKDILAKVTRAGEVEKRYIVSGGHCHAS